jgi:uncharacterized cupredoxin-like copper-binding protein
VPVTINHTFPDDDDPIFGPEFVVTAPIPKSSADEPEPETSAPNTETREAGVHRGARLRRGAVVTITSVVVGEEAMRRMIVGAVVIAGVALFGATAQAGRQPVVAKAPQTSALIKRVNVTAKEFKFTLSAKSAKRGVVIFKVTNAGALQHDFQIKGRKTRLLSHGQSATLRVSFVRKGSYPYTCTVAGHAAAGMKGVFTIT